jgi:hypothetical protein
MTARLLSGARIAGILTLVTLAVVFVSGKLPSPATGIDDANIFFVYARNVSAGDGFVFNPGGERVEGFTSLLWVLIAALATSAVDNPEAALLALNVLLAAATAIMCVRPLSAGWAAAFLVLLLSNLSYVVWHTAALMETALWSFLLTGATLIAGRSRPAPNDSALLAVVTVLLVLTRPEALVWVPVLLGLFYFNRAGVIAPAHARRLAAPAAIVFVLTAGLLTLFRLAYFGYPFPNTFYAKVSPSLVYRLTEGSRYLTSYVTSSAIVSACCLGMLASAVHLVKVRFADARTFALTAAAATGLLVPVLSGGDHFGGFRFYQPVYPLLLLTLVNLAERVAVAYVPARATARLDRRATLAVSALALGLCVALQMFAWLSADPSALVEREFQIAAAGRRLGERATTVFAPQHRLPSIATITVGGLKYAYDGEVVDLMGLNDTRMAHNGGDRVGVRSHAAFEVRTFHELQPDILVPMVQSGDTMAAMEKPDPFVDRVLKGLLQEPYFRARYELAEVRRTGTGEHATFAAWYERGFLTELARSGEFEVVAKP